MKSLICADLHLKAKDQFGIQKDIKGIRVDTRTIYKINKFMEIIEHHNPDRVFICGDLFDSFRSVEWIRGQFFGKVTALDVPIYLLAGNHEIKNSFPVGYAESSVNNSVSVIRSNGIKIMDDFTLVGYTRDWDSFESLTKDCKSKYLLYHGDPLPFSTSYEQVFAGHNHLHSVEGNFHSIGSLFVDSWAEEEQEKGYYIIDNDVITYHVNSDLKLKTYTELCEPSDEYDFVRFKLKGKPSMLRDINVSELKEKYFVDIEIEKEEVKSFEDINVTINNFLKEQDLLKSQISFGKQILKGV